MYRTNNDICSIIKEIESILENRIAESQVIENGKDVSMKLIDYVDYWLNTYKVKSVRASTYDRLITSAEALKKYDIANKSIDSITTGDIQRYVNQLTEHYAYTGMLKMIRIVTAPLAKAAALGEIRVNPAVGLEIPNREYIVKQPRDTEAYTEEEQRKLIAILRLDSKRLGYKVIAFMIESGLRVGETICLQWKDIDLRREAVTINKTVERLANKKQSRVRHGAKSFKSNRTIPLSKAAMSILLSIKRKDDDDFIFSDETGEMISYEAVRYQTQKACKAAGVTYKGMHVFRHTFATNRYNKQTDIKVLSKLLGHASTSITYDTYINLYGDGFDAMKQALQK